MNHATGRLQIHSAGFWNPYVFPKPGSEMPNPQNLIGLIYDAALKPERWPELLEGLAETFEGRRKNKNQPLKYNLPVQIDTESFASQLAIDPDNPEDSDNHLMEHFGQALAVAERFNNTLEQRDSLISLIDRLPNGVILVDKHATVSVKNLQADYLLQLSHGLICRAGKLVCHTHGDTAKLQDIVAELSRPKAQPSVGRGLLVKTGSSEEPVINVSLIPLQQSAFAEFALSGNSVAVFISSIKTSTSIQTHGLKEIYALTKAESKILEKLALGLSIKEISENLHVSVNTVRTHVKHLLIKTGTHRQAELVGLVLSNPVNMLSASQPAATGQPVLFDFKASIATSESLDCKRVLLADDRILTYKEYGDPSGEAVFFCHGAKGSRFQVPPIDDALYASGIRLIVPDRPGFGLSDPLPGRCIYDWPDDLINLADGLQISNFHVGGYSTGGIYALATAHKYPLRIKKVLLIGTGITPSAEGALEGMLPIHKMVFYLACNVPGVYQAFMKLMTKGILHNPQRYIEKMTSTLCQQDVETFNLPHVKEWYMKSSFECGRQGADGATQDILNFARHPGFDLSTVVTPTLLWHGELDQNIPLHLAQKLAQVMPEAELKVIPDQGHMMYYGVLADALHALVRDGENGTDKQLG